MIPHPSSDLTDEPLDDEHVLEPVTGDAIGLPGTDPLVRDLRGRVWRVRRVGTVGTAPEWAGPALVVALAALLGLLSLLI